MKVLIAYLTVESDDPLMSQSFIEGYELHGGTWDGTLDIVENIAQEDVTAEWLQAQIDAGYEMVVRNTGADNDENNFYSKYTDALNNGLLYVTAVGSNEFYKQIPQYENYLPVVRCGSGQRGLGNATGYPCMFLDQALGAEPILDIEYAVPCGDVYNISQIYRLTATTLFMKFEGVTDVRDIGFFGHGIPFYINELSGSDISPLPTGVFYTDGIDISTNSIYFTTPATTGTINGFQNVTGNLTYGNDTADRVLIKVPTYQPLNQAGYAIVIDGVSGFNMDINGVTAITTPLNFDGYKDKMLISAATGGGTYAGGGTASFPSQSYSTPYIGGQLAWIKDRIGSDWYDVLGRAMKTGSRFVSPGYTYQNGYGHLRGDLAILETDTALATPVIETIAGGGYYIKFKWDPIPFADSYEVFYKNELYITIGAHITEFNSTVYLINSTREAKGQRRLIKVRAKRGNDYSEFSNELELKNYYNFGILATEALA